jgi:hypothetical protein
MGKNKETETIKRKRTKTSVEIYKEAVIAVLITGVVFFVLGMKFESRANKQIEQARAQASAQVVEVKK